MSDEGDMPSKNEIKQKARTFLEAVFNNLDLDNNLRVIQSGSWWSQATPEELEITIQPSVTSSMMQQDIHEREVYNSFGITTYYQTVLRDARFPEQTELHEAIVASGFSAPMVPFGFLLPLVQASCVLPHPLDMSERESQNLLEKFAEVVTLQTSTTTYRDILIYVDLGGEPVDLGDGVMIRPIAETELYELSQVRSPSIDYAIQFSPSDQWSVLEIKVKHLSEEGNETARLIYDLRTAVIAALGLAQVKNFTLLPIGRKTNFGPNASGTLIQGSQLPREFGLQTPMPLEKESRVILTEIWPHVKEVMIPGSGYLAMPLRRLVDGLERRQLVDKIVDYCIGLEILLTNSAPTELSYRFALRGAVILGESGMDRQQAFQEFKELYQARNTIVHGHSVAKLDLRTLASNGERLLRNVWNWHFDQKMTLSGATARIDRQILESN